MAMGRFRKWDDETQQQFATAFLANIRLVCPATPDAPNATDAIAMTIFPNNDRDCAAVRDVAGPPAAFQFATNGNGNGNVAAVGRPNVKSNRGALGKHAEMVLLDAFLPPAMPYVGISKQCCLLCARSLQIAGVANRGNRGDLWDAWVFPNFISANPAHLTAFLGPGANAIYLQLSPTSQRAALNLIQTSIKQYDR